MEAQAARMNRESEQNEEQLTSDAEPQFDHGKVATLAYQLWHERGCPEGSPEVDWFQAQQQLGNGQTWVWPQDDDREGEFQAQQQLGNGQP